MLHKPDFGQLKDQSFKVWRASLLNLGKFSSGYVIEIILRFEIKHIEILKNFLVESKFFHFIDRIKISFLICVLYTRNLMKLLNIFL